MEIIAGIQFKELMLLLKQLGLAIAGAASLWGFIFSIRDTRRGQPKSWIVDDWLSMRLFNLFLGGTVLAVGGHLFSLPAVKALAHEGIAVPATVPQVIASLPLMNALFIVLAVSAFVMLIIRLKNEEKFSYLLTPFFAFSFLLAFVMTSYSAWRGSFDSVQIFHFMHGFHSIFTLGSVIVLDFLFLISSRSSLLKQHIYSLFPTISKVIWVGLSLDFISVFLISNYFVVTEKFLFVQTVVAILIINGVLLSGPITRKMMSSVLEKGAHLAARWRKVGSVCGALSITSWLTITALDFFKGLSFGYGQLALIYVSFFVLAYIGHLIFEAREARQSVLTLSGEEMG